MFIIPCTKCFEGTDPWIDILILISIMVMIPIINKISVRYFWDAIHARFDTPRPPWVPPRELDGRKGFLSVNEKASWHEAKPSRARARIT
jgi:hypothetical protein